MFPAKDITLYAKWIDPSEVDDPLAYHRQSALESLKRQYEKYSKSDYSEENWAKLEQAYQDGIKAINEAPAADGKYIEDNIIAELNKALQAMGAIKPDRAGKIDIIVSLDAQTLGLGYYIDPTIVTVDKYTQASYVITDLIKQTIKEKFKMDLEGATVYHVSEPDVDPPYAYMMTGTEANSFYLAQVYWPDQTKAQVAKYIQNYADWTTDGYKDGKYLGEFDYCDKSGWMYSIADRTTGNPSFPGVGAADWRLSDGEVMRWQFTVWGYGADLAADNSEWGQPSIAYKDDGTAAGDKTALTVMVAELRQVYGDKLLRNNRTYFEIHRDVLCNPLATQEELDAAVAKRSQIEEELKDAYAAENAKDLIEAIGTVTLGRKAAIEAARAAYNALTEEQLAIFNELYPDHLKILTDAEARYEELKKQAEQEEIDKAAAQEVIKLIDDIGGVESVTGSSGPKIRKARAAYDALTDAQKKYVTNYDVLVACEEAFDAIPNPVPTPVIPSTPSKPKDDKPTTGSTFADVPSGSWYEDAVKYVSEKGLMNGTSRNGFSPNATTTRGMIVTILARVEGVNTNGTPWYAAGQKWAMDNGISDGTNMVGEVTREQLAAILYRYAKLKGYDTSKSNKLDSFKDADKVSSWAVEAMQWANAEGLINGKNNSMLDPQGKATRAETAAILMRFMQNIAK
ncbi:MAG: S-layer homology domain-containing protein [Acutalibacteraceae bacterium]